MCVAGSTSTTKTTIDAHQEVTMTAIDTTDDSSSKQQQRATRRRSVSVADESFSSSTAFSSTLSKRSSKKDRTYVEHTYTDHYTSPLFDPADGDTWEDGESPKRRGPRGGVVVPFPERLYTMLNQVEKDGEEDVVSWQPHGRCFIVHQPKKFVEEVMPKYFRQSKLTSFQRQVNLYGFRRLTAGKDRGAYYHEMFLRGRPDLHRRLVRIRVKGTGFKSASSPGTEPDFYAFPRCTEAGPCKSQLKSSVEKNEEEIEEEEPVADAALSTPLEGEPLWKPLCAAPCMVPSTELSLDLPELSSQNDDLKKSSPVESMDYNHSWKPMSLQSFARSIVHDTVVSPDACPITPDASIKMVSQELDNALAMMDDDECDDQVHMSSAFPSMISLEGDNNTGSSAEYEDLLMAPLPSSSEETRLAQFQKQDEEEQAAAAAPSECQSMMNMMAVDESIAHNILLIDNIENPADYSYDPLLLLDEVTGPVSCC